ncbi:helix-turn-helix domain-containing protein [Nevskia ramosa]|uniref:helix-turn-helix domain-containing protein n=1 Tax=Nevskia ramosa TaxID=64002 RepID=UPI003D14FF03
MSDAIDSQCSQIRRHLEAGNSITPLDALRMFGSMRIAARIYDLSNQGLNITKEMVDDPQSGKRFASYRLNTQ